VKQGYHRTMLELLFGIFIEIAAEDRQWFGLRLIRQLSEDQLEQLYEVVSGRTELLIEFEDSLSTSVSDDVGAVQETASIVARCAELSYLEIDVFPMGVGPTKSCRLLISPSTLFSIT
jgi:allophanate hydrolase subunit 1